VLLLEPSKPAKWASASTRRKASHTAVDRWLAGLDGFSAIGLLRSSVRQDRQTGNGALCRRGQDTICGSWTAWLAAFRRNARSSRSIAPGRGGRPGTAPLPHPCRTGAMRAAHLIPERQQVIEGRKMLPPAPSPNRAKGGAGARRAAAPLLRPQRPPA